MTSKNTTEKATKKTTEKPTPEKKAQMMKKGDFIELDYTGRLDDDTVFDTTEEKVAKDAGIQKENAKFLPAVICLGENHILKGIEDEIIGKGPGKYSVKLGPEEAFGKKNAKLLKLLPRKVFTKENINPFPGLEVNVDNMYGIIRTVSGGRIIVDFNHPLAGKNVNYEVTVKKVVEDALEKARAVLKNEFNIPAEIGVELKDKKLVIKADLPEEALAPVKTRILELVPDIKDVAAKKEEKDNK
ncbi:peptidylprolyl isomerase [Candidatus Woesearchaeota archaeon]|nr:peptidylprolyl isomerase [Candidatus Woesearchaeota archaeon]